MNTFPLQQISKILLAKHKLLHLCRALLLLMIASVMSCGGNAAVDSAPKDPDSISFASTHPRDQSLAGARMITGRLTKPEGHGPFPAVVLLHGCSGVNKTRDARWVERMKQWGYVTLQVDSLGPRGIKSVCTYNFKDSMNIIEQRVQDAYDAKTFLEKIPFVDPKRIAVMGWSHGGRTTLDVLFSEKQRPFRAGIAFYPSCRSELAGLNAPLLILIGQADDWTPAKACVAMMPKKNTTQELLLKVYPGAHHGFDNRGANNNVMGSTGPHHVEYQKEAAEDSIIQVKSFLKKHLK